MYTRQTNRLLALFYLAMIIFVKKMGFFVAGAFKG